MKSVWKAYDNSLHRAFAQQFTPVLFRTMDCRAGVLAQVSLDFLAVLTQVATYPSNLDVAFRTHPPFEIRKVVALHLAAEPNETELQFTPHAIA